MNIWITMIYNLNDKNGNKKKKKQKEEGRKKGWARLQNSCKYT